VVKAGMKLHRAGDDLQAHAAAQRIFVEAIEQAGVAAVNVAAVHADRIVTDNFAPAMGDIYEKARRCGETLAGHPLDARRLLDAERPIQDAYRELERLVARQSLIWEARRWANAVGFRRPEHDGGGTFLHFERPGEVPGWSHAAGRWPGLDALAPAEPLARLLWLLSPELAAARPWLPTVAEQDERWLTETPASSSSSGQVSPSLNTSALEARCSGNAFGGVGAAVVLSTRPAASPPERPRRQRHAR